MKDITVFTTYEEANSQLQEYLDKNNLTITELCSAVPSSKMGELKGLIHLFAYGSYVYGFRLGINQAGEYCSDPCTDLEDLVEGIQGKLEEQSHLYRSHALSPVFYTIEEELPGTPIPKEKKEDLRAYLQQADELQGFPPQLVQKHIDLYLEFLFKEDKMRGLSEEEQRLFINAYFPKKLN